MVYILTPFSIIKGTYNPGTIWRRNFAFQHHKYQFKFGYLFSRVYHQKVRSGFHRSTGYFRGTYCFGKLSTEQNLMILTAWCLFQCECSLSKALQFLLTSVVGGLAASWIFGPICHLTVNIYTCMQNCILKLSVESYYSVLLLIDRSDRTSVGTGDHG